MIKLIGRFLPQTIKNKINYLFQVLTGYSPQIQQQQRQIDSLSEQMHDLHFELQSSRRKLKKTEAALKFLHDQIQGCENKLGMPSSFFSPLNLDALEVRISLDGSLIQASDLQFLRHRGMENFSGGVYNPGACGVDGGFFALARAEKYPEIERAQDQSKMTEGAVPYLIKSDWSGQAASEHELRFQEYPYRSFRAEDFRLFRFQDKIYVNHALVRFPPFFKYRHDARYAVDQVLAELNLEKKELKYLGRPALDRTVSRIEKNWVYLESNGNLYLFYMFYPHFVVKRMIDRDRFEFATLIERKMQIPGLQSIPFISYSTNPVEYDDKHYFIVVHARRGKGSLDYLHWGVLINKETFMPVYMSRVPIVRGGNARGIYKHVVFVTGVICRSDDFVFTAGEGDYYSSCFILSKKILEENWISLSSDFSG